MALVTVGDIVGEVRTLLQDTDSTAYRYSEASVYQALNEGLLETKKLRPDFFRAVTTPQYTTAQASTNINYPEEFRPTLINYVCGRVQLRDDEATTDQRAGTFITSFRMALTSST